MIHESMLALSAGVTELDRCPDASFWCKYELVASNGFTLRMLGLDFDGTFTRLAKDWPLRRSMLASPPDP